MSNDSDRGRTRKRSRSPSPTLDLRSPRVSPGRSSAPPPKGDRSPSPTSVRTGTTARRRGKRGGSKHRKQQATGSPAPRVARQRAASPRVRRPRSYTPPAAPRSAPLIPRIPPAPVSQHRPIPVTCRWLGGGEGGHNQPRRPTPPRQPPPRPFTAGDARHFEEATHAAAGTSCALTKVLDAKDKLLLTTQTRLDQATERAYQWQRCFEQSDTQRRHLSVEVQRLTVRNKDATDLIASLRSELAAERARRSPSPLPSPSYSPRSGSPSPSYSPTPS